MAVVIVIVLGIAQAVAFYLMVSREPRRAGTGRHQRLFAALCFVAAITVLVVQKNQLPDLVPLAIAAFFVVDAAGLAISATRQDRRDRSDASIHDALNGAGPTTDT